MHRIRILLSVCCAMLLVAVVTTLIFAQGQPKRTDEVIQSSAEGNINWSKGTIRARGLAAFPEGMSAANAKVLARETAIVLAERNLARLIYGVHITSETTVKNLVVEDDTIHERVDGLIKNHHIVSEKVIPDGTYEVVMAVEMYGEKDSLAGTLELSKIVQETLNPPQANNPFQFESVDAAGKAVTHLFVTPDEDADTCATVLTPRGMHARAEGGAETSEKPATAETTAANGSADDDYTGLLIDCRGMKLNPSLCPLLLNEEEKTFYPTGKENPQLIDERGLADYYKSDKLARQTDPLGKNPLVVKGLRAHGAKFYKTNVVLSDDTSTQIQRENAKAHFMDELEVAILID